MTIKGDIGELDDEDWLEDDEDHRLITDNTDSDQISDELRTSMRQDSDANLNYANTSSSPKSPKPLRLWPAASPRKVSLHRRTASSATKADKSAFGT